MDDKPQKIYISLAITGRDFEKQRKRAEELSVRIIEKGMVPVNPFVIGKELEIQCSKRNESAPGWLEYMRNDIYALLDCDGILMDVDTKNSYGCCIELAVAQVMSSSHRKHFTIYHTREQWHDVNDKYII